MNKLVVLPVIAAIAVIAIYYASPLFINTTVDEPVPTVGMMDKESSIVNKEDATMMERVEPMAELAGNFMGVADGIHSAEGMAKILVVHDGQTEHRMLRLENFRSTNGPDLYVYLSKDAGSINGGYISLGRLKGNIGNQNYHIADDIDLSEYSHVLIWCKQFSVLFGYASLTAA